MRREDKQITDTDGLHHVITQAMVCRVALVNDNRPYLIPLNFGFDGKHLYFHSAAGGKKVDILKKNNHVCIEFEQDIRIVENEKPCEWGAHYFTVIIHGTAELVNDLDEKRYGLDQIVKHHIASNTQYPFADKEVNSVLVYRVTIDQIIGKKSG
ncbi:pyridoxamine 5'-phosphate oxidase family protein [Dehalobacter sp. DCM]|uniref:pyridoxamine 5'-phosphate oxidase family protein n=1 Tax=Dehalobacter sp. DCM TaxID=2907827 RepID=UPI003081DC93|nr:pyridoxamine 5'-phosphate oxidase family protein [Dehalobacter sp. DCM]